MDAIQGLECAVGYDLNRADVNREASAPRDNSSRRETRRICWMATTLVIGALAAYANSFRAPFVYDDVQAIIENESIRQLWPISRVLLPLSERGLTVSGRPVLNLSLAFNYLIS